MKKISSLLTVVTLSSTLFTASAQMGGSGRGPSGPDFSGAMAKLFGENPAFSASVEVQAKNGSSGEDMSMPGKIAYLDGKSRFEMNLSEMKGASMPPGAIDQLKQMGMDKLATVSVPAQKVVYLIYPGLKAYAEMPVQNPDAAKSADDFEVKITEDGKETVDGHACVKNKVVVTDKEGKSHEYTVWNATDLKKFPVKIVTNEKNMDVTMTFKDVKFAKPEASLFAPDAGFTKYDSMMAMMQAEMMKRMGGPGK